MSCTFRNALVSIGTRTGSSPPSALYFFACPELAIIHKANTVSTTGDLLLLLTSHLQGLHYRCSGSTTELGTDREAAIIRLVAVLCRLGPWHLPLCTMRTTLRVLPHEWLETTQTHIDIGSAFIPSLPFRNTSFADIFCDRLIYLKPQGAFQHGLGPCGRRFERSEEYTGTTKHKRNTM